jgi:vacuolar-type H+-ATPase subunit H
MPGVLVYQASATCSRNLKQTEQPGYKDMAKHNDQLPPGESELTETELSPLDQIRQAEAEITRRVAAARQQTAHTLEIARKEAAHLVAQAREDGRLEGERRCQEIIKAAEGEATQLIELAQAQTEERSRAGAQRMELAVQQIIALVTGTAQSARVGTDKGGK